MLDLEAGRYSGKQNILIRGDKVADVTSSEPAGGVRTFDCENHYVVPGTPGLWASKFAVGHIAVFHKERL